MTTYKKYAMTTLYDAPQLKQPIATITAKNGKQVEFHSEIHGAISHVDGTSRNWRYQGYELQVQGCNGYWLSGLEKWTPYHEAIDWAVEQQRLRRYVAEVQSEKVIELDVVRRNVETEPKRENDSAEYPEHENLEYAIHYYTETDEEGIPTGEQIKLCTPYQFDERSIRNYMELIIPGSVVLGWNFCNPELDEF